jgi:cysteine desulfurase
LNEHTRIYFDHASAEPMTKRVSDKIKHLLDEGLFFDPGRNYTEALLPRQKIEEARETIACYFGAKPHEVIFTSSGTEAINLAARGAKLATVTPLSALSGVEHQAVKKAAIQNGETLRIQVDKYGILDLEHLEYLLSNTVPPRPSLVHCQTANHEVGSLQPYAEVGELCAKYGVGLHLDACISAGHLPLDFSSLNADCVSISGHKLGAPPGVGALLMKRTKRITPLIYGGSQERGKRAGFENILGIAGLAEACDELSAPGYLEQKESAIQALHSYTVSLLRDIPAAEIYGDMYKKMPHILCFGLKNLNGEAILREMDRNGIAIHSGSACAAETIEPSEVLEAMGISGDTSIRISFGADNTTSEVDRFIFILKQTLEKYSGYFKADL